MRELATYWPNRELTYSLKLAETEPNKYLLFKNEVLLDGIKAVSLPFFSHLPWSNYKSLLFGLCSEVETPEHIHMAFARVKEKKSLQLTLFVPEVVMAKAYPALFKDGRPELEGLYFVLKNPGFHFCLEENIEEQEYILILSASNELSDIISHSDWMSLYHSFHSAFEVVPSWLCSAKLWEELHEQLIEDLVQFALYPLDEAMSFKETSTFYPLIEDQLDLFEAFHSDFRPFLERVLKGYPLECLIATFESKE